MPREQAAIVRLSLGGVRCMVETRPKAKDSIDYSIVQQKPTVAVYISNSLWKYLKYTNTFIVIKCKCSFKNFFKVFKYLSKMHFTHAMSS